MTIEDNKALVRRFLEEVPGRGNMAAVDELASPDLKIHTPLPEQTPGAEGMKAIAFMCHTAFPGLALSLEDMIAEGDRVAVRFVMRGRNSGTLMGFPPTGKDVEMSGMEIFRIKDGKIVEIWGETNLLGLMQQLGAVPPIV